MHFVKQKKQDAITEQINEIKKVEKEIYSLLGIEMED